MATRKKFKEFFKEFTKTSISTISGDELQFEEEDNPDAQVSYTYRFEDFDNSFDSYIIRNINIDDVHSGISRDSLGIIFALCQCLSGGHSYATLCETRKDPIFIKTR